MTITQMNATIRSRVHWLDWLYLAHDDCQRWAAQATGETKRFLGRRSKILWRRYWKLRILPVPEVM